MHYILKTLLLEILDIFAIIGRHLKTIEPPKIEAVSILSNYYLNFIKLN